MINLNFIVQNNTNFFFFFLKIVTGPLTELQISYMCKETLYGLAYLHGMGKMHRDIKVSLNLRSFISYCCSIHIIFTSIYISNSSTFLGWFELFKI